jgi:hypothetical protein
MIRQATTLTISLLLTFSGISQIVSNDTTCLPNEKLRKAINLIELGKIYRNELLITQSKVSVMDSIISNRNKTIEQYKTKDSLNEHIISDYKQIGKSYEKTLSNAEMAFHLQSIQLQKEKFKKWPYLIIGIAGGVLISRL